MVFALMLGGVTLADGVSTHQGNAVSNSRGTDFGVPAGHGANYASNPCNCSLDGGFVRKDLEKGTGWRFTAGSHTVAEPATGLFVGLGLAVIGLMRRRKKKPLENAVWENLG